VEVADQLLDCTIQRQVLAVRIPSGHILAVVAQAQTCTDVQARAVVEEQHRFSLLATKRMLRLARAGQAVVVGIDLAMMVRVSPAHEEIVQLRANQVKSQALTVVEVAAVVAASSVA